MSSRADRVADLVRYSRAGDQFHYLWAARRLLRLIDPRNDTVAVAIEGVSRAEAADDAGAIAAGEAVVDIAEYDGDEDLTGARAVRYLQLRHSTRHADTPWHAADLQGTLQGFAARHAAIVQSFGADVAGKVAYTLVTNRPIDKALHESVEDLASGTPPRHRRTAATLRRYAPQAPRAFWQALVLRGGEGHRARQAEDLVFEVASYLPGPDVQAPLQLKELVVQRALPEASRDPVVRRMDVLRALSVSPDDLFPARNRIAVDPDAVPREQEVEIAGEIARASQPVIIEAPSGRGKSVLSMRLAQLMPPGSQTLVYDCFGTGEYRQRAHPRHRPQDALVQIANELAARGLCDPLLPSPTADAAAYFRAFLLRLRQAVETTRDSGADALLTLVIDAADNAEMGAAEAGDGRAFAQDLLRQPLPDGVRLVMLCRPERTHLLNPPPAVTPVSLAPFTLAETTAHLHQRFPTASTTDAAEFHRRSSENPRVQANALAGGGTLRDVLRTLGPDPTGVDESIAKQLDTALSEVLDASTPQQRQQVNRLCAGLAMLRPLIPLDVLSAVSGAPVDAIRSLAIDFGGGRPLMVSGDALQFRDEPVEDWFRKTYRATPAQVSDFVEILKPLAAGSAYVAATLPAMLLEAGRLDELIAIALSADYLPTDNALQRRDVELQRLQFALRASLKAGRRLDAAKLALRLGGEATGDSRHLKLIQNNADLAGRLLEAGALQDLVSRRGFEGKWLGARHAYEAALLAESPELIADARSRLRLALDWLDNWSRLPREERQNQRVDILDIAQMSLASLRVHGAAACVKDLNRWRPPELRYRVAEVVVRRLLDAGDLETVAALDAAVAEAGAFEQGLAIVDGLAALWRLPSKPLVQMLLRRMPRTRALGDQRYVGGEREAFGLYSLTRLAFAALRLGIGNPERIARLLDINLPEAPTPGWESLWGGTRRGRLAAYALRATLRGEPLEPRHLAPPPLRQEMETRQAYATSPDAREFSASVAPVIPFERLRADWAVAPPRDGPAARAALAAAAARTGAIDRIRQHERFQVVGDVARLWFQLLAAAPPDTGAREAFMAWLDHPDHRVAGVAWADLARIAARTPHLEDLTHDLCLRSLQGEHDATQDVDSKIDTYVKVARALLPIDAPEAAAYLQKAIEVASRLGDEAYDRWDCILQLGDRAVTTPPRRADLAYRLGRCGEIVRNYLDKHFDWTATLRILTGLSPEGGLAMVSRWRDRGVGWFDEVLTDTLQAMLDTGTIDPREAAAFIGFDFSWAHPKLLDAALAASAGAERRRIFEGALSYLRVKSLSEKTLRKLADAARRHGLDATEITERADAEARSAARRPATTTPLPEERPDPWTPARWDALFGSDRLDDPAGFAAVLGRTDYSLRRSSGPNSFWAQAVSRVPAGGASAFLKMAIESPVLGPTELDDFLKAIPPAWRARISIRATLRESLAAMLRQHHTYVWHNRIYQRISLPLVAEAAGEDVDWTLQALLGAFGDNATPLTSGEAFQLVSLLAMGLPPDEALQALDYALGLIETGLQPQDGDGPWSADLRPQDGVDDALAALLWGCLSAPQASIRWQAAHTVRHLCALDRSPVLDRLVALAEGALLGPFADARFQFYSFNARLWLLIALARAALDHPGSVARYRPFLIDQATAGEPHILIRHFAREAALASATTAHDPLPATEHARLEAVNRSPFPVVTSERYGARTGGMRRDRQAQRFHFAYDMDRYWFEPMAVVFNLTGAAAEAVAADIVRDDWGFDANAGWKGDARREAGVFRDGDRMSTSHGSVPETDTLDFYLSFHALMVAAGKLLATHPTHRDDDEDGRDRLGDWLEGHLLTRSDGYWLSDRRDPVPQDLEDEAFDGPQEIWPFTVTAEELRRALTPTDDDVAVWGHWSSGHDPRDRDVSINSALVQPETALALLRALQSIDNARDFRLPSFGDDHAEFSEAPFILSGWIRIADRDKRFDEKDPWSGDIPHPPRTPADFAVEALDLEPDTLGRVWRRDRQTALRSEIWGTGRDQDGYALEAGDRIVITRPALQDLLQKLGLDLIVEVQIDHRLRRHSWQTNVDELDYFYPYSRLFLVRSDGTIHTT